MQRQTKVNPLIQSKVSLAPMAGITDYVLRSLIRRYSPDVLLTTEMISSEALTQVKDTDIVARDDNHTPISYQLSGHKPKMLADSAEYLQRYADMIDIMTEYGAVNACNLDGGTSSVMLYRDQRGLYGEAGKVQMINNYSAMQSQPRRMPNFFMVKP